MFAYKAVEQIGMVYGLNALTKSACQSWLRKFRSGNFTIKNGHMSGRSNEVNQDEAKAVIEFERHDSVPKVAAEIIIFQKFCYMNNYMAT